MSRPSSPAALWPMGAATWPWSGCSVARLAEEIAGFPEPPPIDTVGRLGGALLEAASRPSCARGVSPGPQAGERTSGRGHGGRPGGQADSISVSRLPTRRPGTTARPRGWPSARPNTWRPSASPGEDGDLRSDVYALGVILFELVTLRPPFVGELREIEYAHLSFRPPRLSRFAVVPDALEAVILRCLAKDAGPPLHGWGGVAGSVRAGPGGPERRAGGALSAVNPGTAVSGGALQQVALIFIHQPGAGSRDPGRGAALWRSAGPPRRPAAASALSPIARATTRPSARWLRPRPSSPRGWPGASSSMSDRVAVKPRANGPARMSSPLFSQSARFPGDRDPEAILITSSRARHPAGRRVQTGAGTTRSLRPGGSRRGPGWDSRADREDAPDLFFGRDEELRVLVAEACRAVADRRPRVASVLAEPGIGKTRLAVRARSPAQERDARRRGHRAVGPGGLRARPRRCPGRAIAAGPRSAAPASRRRGADC